MPADKLPELLRFAIIDRDGGACVYCGRLWGSGVDFHVDHLRPRVWGGGDEPGNLAAACEPCNVLKGTANLEAYALMLEQYGRIPSASALVAQVLTHTVRALDWSRAAALLKMMK